MARLGNTHFGLSPTAMRQIYLACVVSIADYGSVVWWKGQEYAISLLQKLQNLAMRKILGVFKTAPILPMEVESCLQPPKIRLQANIRKFALRMSKLHFSHPVNYKMQKERDFILLKQTQLNRIKTCMENILDGGTTEIISPFVFPPWSQNLLYKVHISKKPKDKLAEMHNYMKTKIDWEKTTFIYTDASSCKDGTGIGVGIVATDGFGQIKNQCITNIGENMMVYDGELEAITKAVEYASTRSKPGHQFEIYTDSQAALFRLAKPSDHPGQSCQLRAMRAAKIIANNMATVSLNWIPSHSDIEGNSKADRLAKEGTRITPATEDLSFAMARAQIQIKIKHEWLALLKHNDSKSRQKPLAYRKNFN